MLYYYYAIRNEPTEYKPCITMEDCTTTQKRETTMNIDVNALLKKPILQMTGEEFLALSNAVAPHATQGKPYTEPVAHTTKYEATQYVFGLEGIGKLLGVGKSTAAYYRKTFLAPAIIQGGPHCKIRIDRAEAIRLFEEHMGKNGGL